MTLPRGCRGNRRKRMRNSLFHDLNVPIPRSQRTLIDLIGRFQSTGYGVVAFSHTVYGRPDPNKDKPDIVLKESIIESAKLAAANTSSDPTTPTTLRRLNAVVEELSDIAYFTDSADVGGEIGDHLDAYDIIALSPRSDATFASACSTANRADIIMLDYTTGRLPFKLKSSTVRAAAQLGIAFELGYASAILDPAKRKTLVRIALDLHNACRGTRNPAPRIILSSGTRVASGNDFGALALRAPGDLVSVLKALLKFGDDAAADAMGRAAEETITRCRNRKLGLCPATSDVLGNTIGVDKVTRGRQRQRENGQDSAKVMAPAIGNMKASLEKQLPATTTSDETNGATTESKDLGDGSEEGQLMSHTTSIDAKLSGQEESSDNNDEDDDNGFITFS